MPVVDIILRYAAYGFLDDLIGVVISYGYFFKFGVAFGKCNA
jgi:hypothetical protein